MGKARVIGREQCPKCAAEGNDNSKNNLILYEDGGKFCFSCHYAVPSEDLRTDINVIYEHKDKLVFSVKEWQALKEYTEINPKGYRGLDEDTCKFFQVRHEYDIGSGELLKQYYPLTNISNEICGVKIRTVTKKGFFVKGSNGGNDTELFGQAVFRKTLNKTVLICSGELDALSAYQMLKPLGAQCPAIVSSTIGENGFKQYQAQYEFLNKFEKIVVVPDKDKAGKEALKNLFQVLPKDKMFVVDLPRKDTNEMLMGNLETDFIDRYFKAKPYVPDGVMGSGELFQKLKEMSVQEKIPLPPFMHVLEEMLSGGFTLESIINIVAASGVGKSSYINELIYHWIFNSPYKIGIVSLELSAGQYANALLSRHVGKKLNLLNKEELTEWLETEEAQTQSDHLFKNSDGTDRFYLVEDRSSKLNIMQDLIEQLVIGCGCRVIVLDPLQDLFAGVSIEQQEMHMQWQKIMVKTYNICIININHTRKANSTKEAASTGAMISEEDIAGSSSVYKSAKINILLQRNKLAEETLEKNTTYVWLSKNRDTGTTGLAGKIIYDNQSHTLYSEEEYKSIHPEMFTSDSTYNPEDGY